MILSFTGTREVQSSVTHERYSAGLTYKRLTLTANFKLQVSQRLNVHLCRPHLLADCNAHELLHPLPVYLTHATSSSQDGITLFSVGDTYYPGIIMPTSSKLSCDVGCSLSIIPHAASSPFLRT